VNYLAHGRDALDRPYELAGTALPDWLAACDRGARLRRGAVDAAVGELAQGVRRHLREDAWFHGTEAFLEVSGILARRLRAGDPDARAAFFGHVLTEMLLDAALVAESPGLLDAYYAALAEVDPRRVDAAAASWTTAPPRGLVAFIDLFRRTRFLEGYATDAGLLARLEGVARRVGAPLPRGTADVLPDARRLVGERAGDLLAEPAA
jgi:hypothetical protein